MLIVYDWCCDAPGCEEVKSEIQRFHLDHPLTDHPLPTGWHAVGDRCYCPRHAIRLLSVQPTAPAEGSEIAVA